MICASMPTIRLILARFLPKLFMSTKANSIPCGDDTHRMYNRKRSWKEPVIEMDIELAAIDFESSKDARSIDHESLKEIRPGV